MERSRIHIPQELIADFCRRYRIRKLSLFGSVLRDDFDSNSDVDVLIEFEPDARVGLIRPARIESELEGILGYKVDLNTPGFLSKYFREEILSQAEVQYDEA
jgi:predicted nucleotidyltransferase